MRYSAFLIVILLSSCTSATFLKVDNDGYYRFKKQPIQVKDPFPLRGSFAVLDTESTVDFVFGGGYWMYGGQWAVQVFQRASGFVTPDDFIQASLKDGMKTCITKDRAGSGFNFEVLKIEATQVGGRPAVRGIGVDRNAKIPAVFLATSILFDSRVVVASVVYPLEKVKNHDLTDFASWKSYNSWVGTVSEKK